MNTNTRTTCVKCGHEIRFSDREDGTCEARIILEQAELGAETTVCGCFCEAPFEICAQCKANAEWNDAGGYHDLAERCREYCRQGYRITSETEQAVRLEPCPFCGAIPMMPVAKSGVWRYHYRVKCGTDNCYGNSEGVSAANADAAIEFWNSRASAVPNGDATLFAEMAAWLFTDAVAAHDAAHVAPHNPIKFMDCAERSCVERRDLLQRAAAATPVTAPVSTGDKARYESAHPARYQMTHAVHPDIVVLWFLALKSHWFDNPDNMFYGMREQAKAYLYKWVETGDLADDHTTLEIAVAMKFREWLQSSWTVATSTTPDGERERGRVLGPSKDQAERIVKTWRATDQNDRLLVHFIRQAIDDNVSFTAPPSTSAAIRAAAEEIARLPTRNAYATDKVYREVIVAILSRWFGKGETAAPLDALSRANKLCRSGIGGATVELIFREIPDAQAVHKWLVTISAAPGSPSPGEPLMFDMQRDLVAAGWVAESAIKWRAPDGSLWRGPYGAWKELRRRDAALRTSVEGDKQ